MARTAAATKATSRTGPHGDVATAFTPTPATFKALTIRQPWASAIIQPPGRPFKSVENRNWKTTYRGPLVIHASRTRDALTDETFKAIQVNGVRRLAPGTTPDSLPASHFGAILGFVDLVACIAAESPGGVTLRRSTAGATTTAKATTGGWRTRASSRSRFRTAALWGFT